MALSGSLTTNKYNGDRYYKLTWSATQSIPKNTSTLKWTLSAESESFYADNWYAERTLKLTIDGSVVYSKTDRVERLDGVVATGTKDLAHKTDGSKGFSVSIEAAVYGSSVNVTGSKSFTLDNIPRYAKITTFKLASLTETTATFTWGADAECDKLYYSLNGGSWVSVTGGNPTFTISGLDYYTGYSVKIRVRRKDSQLTTDSDAISIRTYDYPHCIDSPSFYIGDPLTLKFFNPLKREITFNIIANGVQLSYDWTVSGETYEGIYAEDVKTQLYNSIPNAQDGEYQVKVTYGNSVRIRASGNRYTTKTEECRPIFNNVTYRDSNANTVNVTGNNQVLVKGYSNLVAVISADNKMVAVKGATPINYAATIDARTCWADYSPNDVEMNIGAINTAGVNRMSVVAYDSRSSMAIVHKDITVIDYAKPIVYADIKRLNNFENQTTLKISGSYSPVIVNGVAKNWVSQVFYRYREKGGAWSGNIEVTTHGKENYGYYCDDVILSLDNSKAWEFEIIAKDNIDPCTLSAEVGVGQAIFFISSNQKACYINGQKIIMYDVVDTWGGW